MRPPLKAVIFDFDGLMIDTESPAYAAWSAIYREHGAVLELALWVECVGSTHARFDPVDHLMALTGKELDRAALFADKEGRKAKGCSRLPLMPGVEARIVEARALGLKIAVASSSSSGWVRGHLDRHRLTPRLDLVRTREDVTRVKPFPDLYLSAAAGLGVDPGTCLVFEDSLNGVRAAKAAGARCLAVPNPITRGLDFSAADGVHRSLADVSLEAFLLPPAILG
jgi:beta-phosphoglucomutase-like phosphatase (HAD superfamily)